ncbi:MAG: hypothetical protein K6B13_07595, partial [Prevotella sp.]|nr:hypothetical protein [Prevotella sp.]
MKKILLLVMTCLMLPMVAGAQTATTDKFTVSDLVWDDDNDCYVFTVSLDGSRIYTAYNLDIFLPNGIDVEKKTNGDLKVYRSKNKKLYTYDEDDESWSHSVSSEMPVANKLRVA